MYEWLRVSQQPFVAEWMSQPESPNHTVYVCIGVCIGVSVTTIFECDNNFLSCVQYFC